MIRSTLLTTALVSLCLLPFASTCGLPITRYAPVPSTGIGPPVSPSIGFRVECFGQGAYMITDGQYQSLFFVTDTSVIAVDAPPSIGRNILKAIRTITDLPISHLIYSHAHADHIGAAYLLTNPDVTVVAHEETVKTLSPSLNQARPLPNITFATDYTLTVANQTLQLSYKGPNHQPGNIFIYAPTQKLLMLVDVIYPGWIPYARLGESQNIPGWINAHDQILEYDFTHYIGGHLNRAGTREDVLIQKEYVTDLYNNCAEAILLSGQPSNATNPVSAAVFLPLVSGVNPNNSWAVDRYFDDTLGDYCARKTKRKWLGRLAGADVFDRSNAETMLESLKIDFGLLGPLGVL